MRRTGEDAQIRPFYLFSRNSIQEAEAMYRTFALAIGIGLATLSSTSARADEVLLEQIYGTGVHAFNAGDFVGAHTAFTNAIKGGTNDPRTYYFRGLACLRLGREQDAKADFQKGAELESGESADVYPVARSLERIQGKPRQMLEQYRLGVQAIAIQRREAAQKQRYRQRVAAEEQVLRTAPPRELPGEPGGLSGRPVQPDAGVPAVNPFDPTPRATPAPAPGVAPAPAVNPFDPVPAAPAPTPGVRTPAMPAEDPFGGAVAPPPATVTPTPESPFGAPAPATPVPATPATATPAPTTPTPDDPFGGAAATPAPATPAPTTPAAPPADPFGGPATPAAPPSDPFGGPATPAAPPSDPFGGPATTPTTSTTPPAALPPVTTPADPFGGPATPAPTIPPAAAPTTPVMPDPFGGPAAAPTTPATPAAPPAAAPVPADPFGAAAAPPPAAAAPTAPIDNPFGDEPTTAATPATPSAPAGNATAGATVAPTPGGVGGLFRAITGNSGGSSQTQQPPRTVAPPAIVGVLRNFMGGGPPPAGPGGAFPPPASQPQGPPQAPGMNSIDDPFGGLPTSPAAMPGPTRSEQNLESFGGPPAGATQPPASPVPVPAPIAPGAIDPNNPFN